MLPPPDIPANYKRSLSYFWLKDRLAIMLTRIIDSLCRRRNELEIVNQSLGTEQEEEVIRSHKLYLKEFPRLKNEMTTNKTLLDLEDPETDVCFSAGRAGVTSDNYKWFSVPFQFAEEYFYKRINLFGKNGEHKYFANFDPYKLFKDETFTDFLKESSKMAEELLNFENAKGFESEERVREHLYKAALSSICAENCDSSFFLGKPHVTYEECEESLIPRAESKGFNIFVNKFNELYTYLAKIIEKQLQLEEVNRKATIDIYLNFGGFDLFSTFCLAEILQLFIGKGCKITFYTQPYPKFFLATKKDVEWLLTCKTNDGFVQSALHKFCQRFTSGQWTIKDVPLSNSSNDVKVDLCILKGDYHYRQLLGGLRWKMATPLREAIKLQKEHIYRVIGNPKAIFTARAIKSDYIVDLKEAQGYSQIDYLTKMFTIYNTVNCLDMNFVDLSTPE